MIFFSKNPPYTSKYFGKIDFKNLSEWYEKEVSNRDYKIDIAIHFENKQSKMDISELRKIDNYIDGLSKKLDRIEMLMLENYKNNGVVKEYAESIIEYVQQEEIIGVLNKNYNPKITPILNIVHNLHVVNIIFYPDHPELFAVIDYSLNQDITDDLLVIQLSKNNTLSIMIES